ncbi:MAG: GTP-binding protein EngA [uncultured Acidimicrobiales bacterium]|uniref:GTPase Der n=1 Tax=uncultured Acidimicrobiales bacterium TaxID=310071 RepID=A0A6J4H9H7_9ACTN|nr:MAG: GTP-binding protein EngA [uncultured Acidimicrobiales bacterium]
MAAAQPTVAIVGRPNVGKSTLVNRITGRRDAIVEDTPGVTRDRKEVEADWAGRSFTLVDTGGWLPGGTDLDAKVTKQSEQAIAQADVVLLVVDTTVGVTDGDERMAGLLRRRGGSTFVVANKVDSEHREPDIWEFAALGLGDPVPVSAIHGRGTGDLLDLVVGALPPQNDEPVLESEESDDGPVAFSVAVVGRPNVGKSTLFNRLVGEERSVVHDLAGTTRDSVDTVLETDEGRVRFVDTAGLRRRGKEAEGPEYYSLVRALQSIDKSDTALLVIDATEGVTHQDQRLAERIDAAGSPVVIVLNKWELLDDERKAEVQHQVADMLGFLTYAPVLKVSALTGLGVHKLLPALNQAEEAYSRRVPTAVLNRVVQAAQAAHPPPNAKIQYATQGAVHPPTFTLFANRDLPATYLRYIERKIREHFDLGPTPLKIRVRRRGG